MKLTEKVIQTISKHIEDGLPIRFACILAKVHEQRYYDWHKRGGEEFDKMTGAEAEYEPETMYDERCVDFYVAVEVAHAKYCQRVMGELWNAEKFWQKFCWILERKYRKDFGRFGAPLTEIPKTDEAEPITNESGYTPTAEQVADAKAALVQSGDLRPT